jgi:hypothetical protein
MTCYSCKTAKSSRPDRLTGRAAAKISSKNSIVILVAKRFFSPLAPALSPCMRGERGFKEHRLEACATGNQKETKGGHMGPPLREVTRLGLGRKGAFPGVIWKRGRIILHKKKAGSGLEKPALVAQVFAAIFPLLTYYASGINRRFNSSVSYTVSLPTNRTCPCTT